MTTDYIVEEHVACEVAYQYPMEAASPAEALAQVRDDELREPWDEEQGDPVEAEGRWIVRERGQFEELLSEPIKVTERRIVVKVNGGLVEFVDIPAGAGHVVVEVRDYDARRNHEPQLDSEYDGTGQRPVDGEGLRFLRTEWRAGDDHEYQVKEEA